MNTDVRSSAIVLLALVQLRPEEKLLPDAVRWLMAARQGERWGTTQENAWAILALTEWMAQSGELEGNYRWEALLNGADWQKGAVTPAEVDKSILLRVSVAELVAGQTNGVTLRRSAPSRGRTRGSSTTRRTWLPTSRSEKVTAQSRGLSVSREYRQAECYSPAPPAPPWMPPSNQVNKDDAAACPPVTAAKAGDTITARLTLVVPAAASYVVVEDPLPAGLEAVDTSLRTTSLLAAAPQVRKAAPGDQSQKPPHWSGWWWSPTHVELRDEKVVLFATSLAPGTYEFTYQLRAATPGQFLVMPVTAHEMYFPEVRGNGAGGTFNVNE